MKAAVVGCGYVGLVTAVGLAEVGHEVVGIEADPGRRDILAGGKAPFHEPGLDEAVRRQRAEGRLEIAGEPERAADADVVFLAVQTPPREDRSIDLGYLEAAARQVTGVLVAGQEHRRVVAVRSTTVPGTTDRLIQPIVGARAAVAANPEFLREGTALQDFLRPDRIVVGTDDEAGWEVLRALYEPLGAPVIRTSPTTAELAKYTSNALLATLISFSNEIARISETHPGVDVEDVLEVVRRDRRLTPTVDGQAVEPGILAYLKAGCGFGGSCLPKDLSALLAEESRRGLTHPLLEGVLAVNETQPGHVVDLLEQRLGVLRGRPVAVLGVAFKGGTDDLRAAPGLHILDGLLHRGANAVVFDPLVPPTALAEYAARGVDIARGIDEALESAEACVITTDSPEFDLLAERLRDGGNSACVVLDARRFLQPSSFDGAYLGVGRGPTPEVRSSRAKL